MANPISIDERQAWRMAATHGSLPTSPPRIVRVEDKAVGTLAMDENGGLYLVCVSADLVPTLVLFKPAELAPPLIKGPMGLYEPDRGPR